MRNDISVRGSFGYFLNLLLLVILIIVLIILFYFFYLNLSREPEIGEVVIHDIPVTESIVSQAKQFFSNTKFNHNSISFQIDPNCDNKKRNNVIRAFDIVSEEVGLISFQESSKEADIEVSCSEGAVEEVESDYFIAGEGGAKEIIQTGRYNVINEGIILLYNNENSKTSNCVYPSVELHELMHVFGFDHVNNEKSLMYPYLESCEQRLDQSIIDELKRLYSKENLPDLYFEKVEAIKHKCGFGTCLNFNLTIRNSGVVDADNVKFSIFEDEKFLETRDMKDVDFGAGIIIEIENFKLKSRNSKEISFIIDNESLIREIDEKNNEMVVKF